MIRSMSLSVGVECLQQVERLVGEIGLDQIFIREDAQRLPPTGWQ
jgi:hypothetical protein